MLASYFFPLFLLPQVVSEEHICIFIREEEKNI